MKPHKWALAAFLALSGTAHAQGNITCQRLSQRLPERPNPAVHTYGGGLGNELIASIPGHQFSSMLGAERVVVLLGEDWVWIIILRVGSACPLPPIERMDYERARRRLLGTTS